jgi:hypothetical protein
MVTKLTKKLFIAVVCIAAFASAVSIVSAGTATSANIYTTSDVAGLQRTTYFVVNQPIYIFWTVGEGETIDLRIYNQAGTLVADVGTNLVIADQPRTWSASTPGIYYIVYPSGTWIAFAVASVTVVPESILGTVMATVAGFAAFGTIGLVKHKTAKNRKGQ